MCLAAHLSEFLGWTPANVKLLLPPRQSRGNSHWISARNVLAGRIAAVHEGAANCEIEIKLDDGAEVVASITRGSANRMELAAGDAVSAIIKASHVMVGV